MIDDDEIRNRLDTVLPAANPAPATRGNPSESARRGTSEFDELMEDLITEYVEAEYPGLVSYAYQAEAISIEAGEKVMDEILDGIVEIRWPDDAHPEFRLKGETEWKSTEDTDDFPQPSTDPVDEESEDGEEENLCYEDCSCPESGCDCELCACGNGKVCCCSCGQ